MRRRSGTLTSFIAHHRSPPHPRIRRTSPRATAALVTVVVVAAAVSLGTSLAQGSAVATRSIPIKPVGVGTVRFGQSKQRAVLSLRALFGTPNWQGVNTGCGTRFTEVEWGNLIAEFRARIFTGYRYVEGGYPLPAVGAGRVPRRTAPFPRLATTKGMTLGSTLANLRKRYGALHVAGASKWRANNGLFFVDNAGRDQSPPSSRIIEIKIGTCGDF